MAIPPFVVPFVTGALTELQEQKRVSDEIAGSVVDNVSKHVLGVEIPAEKKLIKAQEDLKNQYASRFGTKVASGMDAMGLFESGSEQGLFNSVRITFGDKYSIDEIAKKIDGTSDEDYAKLASVSFIGDRKKALEDRAAHIDKVLGDTANIKDLLIDKKPTGIAKFIGEPLGKKDETTAQARLTQELEGSTAPVTTTGVDAASILGLDKTTGANYSGLGVDERARLVNQANLIYNRLEKNQVSKRFKDNFSADYDPNKPFHGPSKELYGFRNFYQNYYLPQEVGISYDLENKIESEAATKTIEKPGVPKKVTPEVKAIKGEEFEYQGKIYPIPPRFKGQSLPETVKRSIASQQDKFQFKGLDESNPQVQLAQEAINKARAVGNDDAVEAIKDQLRKDLRVSNLEGLIK
jgi:hypothetical protein